MLDLRAVRLFALVLVFAPILCETSAFAQRYHYECREDLDLQNDNGYSFAISQLCGDTGLPDIAAIAKSDTGQELSALMVYENLGNGFTLFQRLVFGYGTAYSIWAEDFDDDGLTDLAVGFASYTSVLILLNEGASGFVPADTCVLAPGGAGGIVFYVEANDFDQDGTPEIVAAEVGAACPSCVGKLHYIEYDPSAETDRFQRTVLLEYDGGMGEILNKHPLHIHTGDLNGDSLVDLIASGDDKVDVLLGNGGDSAGVPLSSSDSLRYLQLNTGYELTESDMVHAGHDSSPAIIVNDFSLAHWYLFLNTGAENEVPFTDDPEEGEMLSFELPNGASELAVGQFFLGTQEPDIAFALTGPGVQPRLFFFRGIDEDPWFEADSNAAVTLNDSSGVFWLKAQNVNGNPVASGGDLEIIFMDYNLGRVTVLTNDPPHTGYGLCGDLDRSGWIDASDLTLLIDYAFFGGSACSLWTNVDGQGESGDASDVQYMVDHVFFAGPPPDEECGME